MTGRVLFRFQAEAELVEAAAWYEARQTGLGAAFVAAVESTVDVIGRHPKMYPVIFGSVRRAVMRRFHIRSSTRKAATISLCWLASTPDAILNDYVTANSATRTSALAADA